MTEYVVPQGKHCGWNGFFARHGDRFADRGAMLDKHGDPIPAAVLERFLKTGCLLELKDGKPAPAEGE